MITSATNLESLAGRPGTILVVVKPAPCRGPLTAIVVTKPAALCLQQRGVIIEDGGAYVQRGVLFCRFKAADLGAALPAVRGYFDEIGCQNFARLGWELAGELQEARDFDREPHRSYLELARSTWVDSLQTRWKNFWITGRGFWIRRWFVNRLWLGDVSRSLTALAILSGALALGAAVFSSLILVAICATLSGALFISSLLTVPPLSRDAVERLNEEAAKDARRDAAEFRRKLALKPDGENSEGDHRE